MAKRSEPLTNRGRFFVISLILLIGYPASGADDVRAAIEAANTEFGAVMSRSDAAGLAALYTADGQLLPAQSDFVTGTQAIAEFWQGVIDSGTKGASLTTTEVESHGDTATEVGTYRLFNGDGKVTDQGKYIVMWKKEGDAWKLHRDIWTTSLAPNKP